MRASRLLSLLILLQLRGRVSAEALAEEFEVSVRTIYRDVDQLSATGVPIYAERGRNGGFQLMADYRTSLTGFTFVEAEALLFAGAAEAAQALGLGPQLAAARLKLLASLPAEIGESAQRVSARFHLDPVNWYMRTDTSEHLMAIAPAVWQERRIRVKYESWNAVVSRSLDPLGLALKAGTWYLVALSNGQPRTYRISNIRDLTVTDEIFKRPKRFDLARFWNQSAHEFEQHLLHERATLKISPSAFGDRLEKEVREGCSATTRGKPAAIQELARHLLAEPDHRGVAKMLRHIAALKQSDSDFSDIEIDCHKEFWDAVRLDGFSDVEDGLAEITHHRTYLRPKPPPKAISTIHKAKGLECGGVIVMPCDAQTFPDRLDARCLLYVALTRATHGLLLVVSRTSPSPLLAI